MTALRACLPALARRDQLALPENGASSIMISTPPESIGPLADETSVAIGTELRFRGAGLPMC